MTHIKTNFLIYSSRKFRNFGLFLRYQKIQALALQCKIMLNIGYVLNETNTDVPMYT